MNLTLKFILSCSMYACLSHLFNYNDINLLFNICYKYCGCDDDDDDICGIETQDDWVMIDLWDVGY